MFRGLHIGVDRYADLNFSWHSGAVRDAEALHSLFADTFGDQLLLMADEAATAAAIRGALSTLASAAVDDDIVVITYAGHGSEDHFLIPHDGVAARIPETCISLDELADLISQIPGQTLFLALDCCFSGGLGARVFSSGLRPRSTCPNTTFAALDRFTGEGRVVLTASADDQPAMESVRHRHGLLTFRLMEALQGAPEVRQGDQVNLYGSPSIRPVWTATPKRATRQAVTADTRAVLGNPGQIVTAKSRLGTPDGPTRCEQVGPSRSCRSVEFAVTYPGGERGPLGRGERQGWAGWIGRVHSNCR